MKEYHLEPRIYDGRSPPSVFRGWLTKLRGILTFNPHVKEEGEVEIFDAHAYKRHLREEGLKHHDSRRSHSRSKSRHRDDRNHPCLHFRHRCHPSYHGSHLRFWGFLTRNRDHMTRGLQLHENALSERRRERRRRLQRLADEGLAIRMGARTIIQSGSGRRRHHSQRRRRDPVVVPVPPGASMAIAPSAAGSTAQAYYSPSRAQVQVVPSHHTHGRSRSRSQGIPLSRSMSSRHGGTSTPVVTRSADGYQESHAIPVVPTIVSSHHEPIVPYVRSSRSQGHASRHGHSRSHGHSDAGLARTSSSRHGHRHHHSRNPSEVVVSP